MISSPGIGSGLDISSLVQQLVAIEQQPINRLFVQEAQFGAQISGFGQIKSALSSFQDSLKNINSIDDFAVLAAKSSDEAVLEATAGPVASKGVFNLTVSRIAETHRLGATTAFADTDTTTIGTAGDTITIDVGGDSFDVDYGGLTLGEARDAINAASGNSGVTASILKDDVGNRLLLTADETGSDNFVTLTYNNGDPFSMVDLNTDRDGDLSFTSADLDAEIDIDGQFTSTQSRNTVTDLIQGVTINLQDTGTSVLTIDEDVGAVENSIKDFIDSYNGALKTLRDLRQTTLADDSVTLFSMENQLRGILNSNASGNNSFSSIYELGVSSTFVFGTESTSNGQLELDSTVLKEALNTDADGVAALFAESGSGLISRMEALVEQFTQAGGLIDGKTDSLSRRIDNVEDRRVALEARVAQVEERLFREFSALDGLVSSLQLTGNFLAQQLSVLQPINSNN